MSQDTTAASTPAEGIVVEDGYKVFVGNLSFQTTKEELSALFSKPTPVLKANIITRGSRSLGYGFVAYETLAQAEKAVSLYNKLELGGREINVEVAKPKVERTHTQSGARESKDGTEGGVKPRSRRGGRRRGRGGRYSHSSRRSFSHRKTQTQSQSQSQTQSGEDKDETSGTDRIDGWGSPTGDNEDKEIKDINSTPRRGGRGPRRGRGRGRGDRRGFSRRGGRTRSSGGASGGDKSEGSSRPFRSSRSRPKATGPPSKTTVFIANLPFAMDDDALKELFNDYKVVSAHVVRRRATGRSKGFGFVELADETEQQKVIEKSKEFKPEGRELVIKVAHSEEHKDDDKGEGSSSGASSPTSSA